MQMAHADLLEIFWNKWTLCLQKYPTSSAQAFEMEIAIDSIYKKFPFLLLALHVNSHFFRAKQKVAAIEAKSKLSFPLLDKVYISS